MKLTFITIGLVLSFSLGAQTVLSEKSDDKFGGFYVDVDKSVKSLSKQWGRPVRITDVLSIQKDMRDCLQLQSKSFFRQKQNSYLDGCITQSEKRIRSLNSKPIEKGFTIVFDMDETLLTQWHKISLEDPKRTTFIVKNRDHVLSEIKSEMTLAPKGVTIRPGMLSLLAKLVQNKNIGKIYFFTAREDSSAEELKNYFLGKVPTLKQKFGGLFARNFLRLDTQTLTPSKDLRIISPSLKSIILIDDNTSRVMQKNLNFTIPKFNADLYLDALTRQDKIIIEANEIIAPFVSSLIEYVTKGGDFRPYSTTVSEQNKTDWGKKILEHAGVSQGNIDELEKMNIYHQDFYGAETIKL